MGLNNGIDHLATGKGISSINSRTDIWGSSNHGFPFRCSSQKQSSFLGGVDFLGSNLDLALKSSAEYRLDQDVIFHAPILV